jgi:hypothetical protein
VAGVESTGDLYSQGYYVDPDAIISVLEQITENKGVNPGFGIEA